MRSHLRSRNRFLIVVLSLVSAVSLAASAGPANAAARPNGVTGDSGLNTYRQLDQLPELTSGVQTREYSSFDRTGGNADYNHPLGSNADGSILAQRDGPGEIDQIWMTGNVPSVGTVKIVLDGKTVVDATMANLVNGSLGAPFTYPLVANDSQSSGGFYVAVPMTFTRSMIVTASTDPTYYHVIYRTFADATGLSTFDPTDPATDVLATMQQSGAQDPKGAITGTTTQHGTFQLMAGQSTTLASGTGSGQLTAIQLRLPHVTNPASPPFTDDGRAFGAGGSSSFTVALNPANTGIRITRRLDTSVANQVANIAVNGVAAGQWQALPGTAGIQFADETVTVPAAATQGRSSASVVNTFVSSALDFNEFRYDVEELVGGVWLHADTVDVGPDRTATEAAHNYRITGQTWSGLRLAAYPPAGSVTDDGRAFGSGGGNSFAVAIDPSNTGVRLTRRLDPGIGSQVAAVAVNGVAVGNWAANPVGPAGSWLDESLEIPASITSGKSSITIKTTFVSSALDFNEFTYWVDSHVANGLSRTDTLDVGNAASESAHGYTISGQTWSGSRTYRYPASDAGLTGARIRISVDGTQTVDTPLNQFFGAAEGAFGTESLMSSVDLRPGGWLSSWWPMPYGKSYSISILNGSGVPLDSAEFAVSSALAAHWASDLAAGTVGYFHATSASGATTTGQDWSFLHANGHGKIVGIVAGMNGPTSRGYLEGDERSYVDGSRSPDLEGTGTEDFYQGGYYFSQGPFTGPFNGETSDQANGNGDCPANTDCTGAYRWLLTDALPFDSSISFGIEHGGVDDVAANYSTTAFWYGQGAPVATQTDSLTLGDASSESAHHYTTTDPGPAQLASTYEGNDGTPVTVTQNVRTATAPVSFTVAVAAGNTGVLLYRTSDQNVSFQQAEVRVDGTDVGTWLEPLGNTDHRWLDDEFALPAAATSGKTSITVTITPTIGSPGWTAASYRALSLTG